MSAAEELAEATLIAAAQTYEERKLPHIAHLIAAVGFEPDLDHADAHQLILLAQGLSYRQLVILATYHAIHRRRRVSSAQRASRSTLEGRDWSG